MAHTAFVQVGLQNFSLKTKFKFCAVEGVGGQTYFWQCQDFEKPSLLVLIIIIHQEGIAHTPLVQVNISHFA